MNDDLGKDNKGDRIHDECQLFDRSHTPHKEYESPLCVHAISSYVF